MTPAIWSRRWGSTAICWRSRGCWPPVSSLWKRAAAGGRGQPPAGGEAGGSRCRQRSSSRSPSGPGEAARGGHRKPARARRGCPPRGWDLMPAEPIDNLAGELKANRNLLSALAGPSIAVTVEAEGGAQAGAADRRGSDPDAGQPGQERRRGHARGRVHSSPAERARPQPSTQSGAVPKPAPACC